MTSRVSIKAGAGTCHCPFPFRLGVRPSVVPDAGDEEGAYVLSEQPGALRLNIPDALERTRELSSGRDRFVLGVVGPPGSGKSTLVETMLQHSASLGVAHVPMDGFHLADQILRDLGLLHHKGAPETFDAGGYASLLRRLRNQNSIIYAPAFDRALEQPIAGAKAVLPSTRLVITEGNYLLLDSHTWRQVRAQLDEVWYVDTPKPTRVARLVARHEAFGKSATQAREWVARVDEPNARTVESTRSDADHFVNNGGPGQEPTESPITSS